MPFRFAYLFVAVVLAVTIIGFWPSYFAKMDSVPFAFHAHAFVATAWVVLTGIQSWSIHNRKRELHRKAGKLSMFLFPALIATLVAIANVSADRTLDTENSFWQVVGPGIGYVTFTAICAFVLLFTQALRYRRNVFVHAAYMLAPLFLLWESNFGRVLMQLNPSIHVLDSIVYSDIMAAAFAVFLFMRDREHSYPFLIAAAFLGAQIVGIYLFTETPVVQDMFRAYAQLPPILTISVGLSLGILAIWLGWTRPITHASVAKANE